MHTKIWSLEQTWDKPGTGTNLGQTWDWNKPGTNLGPEQT